MLRVSTTRRVRKAWRRQFILSIRLSRRIGRKRRHGRVHVVPRLRTLDEDVGFRSEPARIIECADPDADEVGPGRYLHVERSATLAAENARNVVAGVGLGDVALG